MNQIPDWILFLIVVMCLTKVVQGYFYSKAKGYSSRRSLYEGLVIKDVVQLFFPVRITIEDDEQARHFKRKSNYCLYIFYMCFVVVFGYIAYLHFSALEADIQGGIVEPH